MAMVNVIIDNKNYQVPEGMSVLQACRMNNIYIPTLCYHPELTPEGACRLCVVEVNTSKTLVASCVYPVSEGMIVKTNTDGYGKHARPLWNCCLPTIPKIV